ncbi:MAG: hypothetical protein CVV45_08715 [Spirochaetae bacterium HGW-Spirochaetae-10]|nr:MAG: hypothetical protein CVV45_08715 [Spirochaetae bacterium HGW-Spirochaetae-10]
MKKEEHLIEALLVYSNEVYQQIVAGIEPLNITDNNEREILATSLFLKVLEMSYAIMHLARSGPHSA